MRRLSTETDALPRPGVPLHSNLLPGGMRFLVWMAESIETARTMLEDIRDFNLVLVDVLMPDGNGYDLLPLIKEARCTTHAARFERILNETPAIARTDRWQ